jgi:hypothetical protein
MLLLSVTFSYSYAESRYAEHYVTLRLSIKCDYVSLTLVTSFFETSKLWACIIYALEGLECQG